MKSAMEESGDQQLAVLPPLVEARRGVTAEDLMPVLDLAAAVRRHNFMTEVARNLMVSGVDYGVIPGTIKPTLLKPGAERLSMLFGLSPELHEVSSIEDWDGTGEGHGEPLFYYRYRVRLMKNGILLGEGTGSCNSRESKFRYRTAERRCVKCGKSAIIRGKEEFGGGWLCFAKKGGCGAKFKDGDAAVEGQSTGRTANPDIADQVNTIQKMAHKRALVAAVLIATNASEFYTQDVEDMAVIDIPSAQSPQGDGDAPVNNGVSEQPKTKPSEAQPGGSKWSWGDFQGMIGEFAKLHERLGPGYDHIYRETLAEFGVAHSNEFSDYGKATACYRKLRAKVLRIEEARQQAAEESAMIDVAEMLQQIQQPEEEQANP